MPEVTTPAIFPLLLFQFPLPCYSLLRMLLLIKQFCLPPLPCQGPLQWHPLRGRAPSSRRPPRKQLLRYCLLCDPFHILPFLALLTAALLSAVALPAATLPAATPPTVLLSVRRNPPRHRPPAAPPPAALLPAALVLGGVAEVLCSGRRRPSALEELQKSCDPRRPPVGARKPT